MRHLKTFSLVCVALLLASPAFAAEPADPTFLLEEIVVEGNRNVSPEIVIAESLLKTSESYSEDDLRDAVYRIKRLPFLIGVDFELRKGSTRGRYILAIEILETKRFFYGVDLRVDRQHDDTDFVFFDDTQWALDFLIGWRHFVGSKGILYATLGDIGTQVGYSNYNFLNRNLFLDVSFERSVICCAADDDLNRAFDANISTILDDETDTFRITLGIPRSARQLFRIDASYRSGDGFTRLEDGDLDDGGLLIFLSEEKVKRTELTGSWIYDTTDDPIFPHRGDELIGSLGIRRTESEATVAFAFGDVITDTNIASDVEATEINATLFGRRHWPLSNRQSLAASFELRLANSERDAQVGDLLPFQEDFESWAARVAARHAVDLIGVKRSQPQRRLRWENRLELNYVETTGDDFSFDRSQLIFGSDLIYRNRWGVLRFRLQIIDVLEQSS